MTRQDRIAALRKTDFLSRLEDRVLGEVSDRSRQARYRPGDRILGELEAGADVFVIVDGQVEISVESATGGRLVLGTLGPGHAFGEMSSLTGELHSASVVAVGQVEALVLPDAYFDRLRERFPLVAVALVELLGSRLAAAERTVDDLLESRDRSRNPDRSVQPGVRRGSIVRAWRELVVNRRRDLGFLTLAGFVATLLAASVVAEMAVLLGLLWGFAPQYETTLAIALKSANCSA